MRAKTESQNKMIGRALGTALVAQQAPSQLTLEEAISIAKQNNPMYLSTSNDMSAANWQEREAYAAFLPTISGNMSGGWQEAGVQRIGTLVFADQITDWAFSSYGINFNLTLSGQTLFGVPNARANKRATEARIDAAEWSLESLVAFQYMAALRALDQVDVAQRQLDRARQNMRIVTTRVETGASAGIDGKQAEVDLGRAEVTLIQAQRDLRQGKLLLAEQLGVALDTDVELSSQFEVFEPDFDMSELMGLALNSHPSLRAFVAQESASKSAARQIATSQYLPTVRLSSGIRGTALQALNETFVTSQAQDMASARMGNCEFNNALNARLTSPLPSLGNDDCGSFALTNEGLASALSTNEVFPFDFTKLPLSFNATVSIPIWSGFSRQRQVSQANNVAEDAAHSRRAEELRLRTAVRNAYDNLTSALQVMEVETRNRALSEKHLQLQQRRYALGAAGMLELMDAQTLLTASDQLYLNALYDFHYSLITLEAAVGQPLRSR